MSLTARRYGLLPCPTCSLVCHARPDAVLALCPRCGTPLHQRKPASVARTWAYLVAACILYVPANLLPIMETQSLFASQRDTIMSGVVFLWTSGSWPLAIIVFVASVMVPLLKLLVLSVLLITAQARSTWRPQDRTRLYRLLEAIGRWSMLDVYVVTLLVALVRIQSFAVINPGPGAVAFGAVVVLTMLAAMSFDPRLTWDPVEEDEPASA